MYIDYLSLNYKIVTNFQSRTDRIVFKLFGKDPGEIPTGLRKQVFLYSCCNMLLWKCSHISFISILNPTFSIPGQFAGS